jgi:hypothetical protein
MDTAQRIKDGFAAVAIWLVCASLLVGLAVGWAWLDGEDTLDAPGWDCSLADKSERTGKCYPANGWHFEDHPRFGKIAVRDLTATQKERDLDIDTAAAWRDLTNEQRREILANRATIYDYFDFHSRNSN